MIALQDQVGPRPLLNHPSSVVRKHVERDCPVLQADREDDKSMKELVISEDRWHRVGSTEGVDKPTGRIGNPTRNDEQTGSESKLVHDFGKDDDSNPTQWNRDRGGEPLRRLDPDDLEHDGCYSPCPDSREYDHLQDTVEDEKTKWRIAACDQQVDAGMVNTSHPKSPRPAPGDAMVDTARAEHKDNSRSVDDRGNTAAVRVRLECEDDSSGNCEQERQPVTPATQARTHRRRLSRAGVLAQSLLSSVAAMTEDNATAREVVGGELDLDAISGKNTNAVAPHLARGIAKRFVPVVKRDPVHPVAKRLGDLALELDLLFFLGDVMPLPQRKWRGKKGGAPEGAPA
jgi:hypothetical protein